MGENSFHEISYQFWLNGFLNQVQVRLATYACTMKTTLFYTGFWYMPPMLVIQSFHSSVYLHGNG